MMVSKKINPFSPGSPVPPGTFAGRIRELEQIEKSLCQTINGRPQRLLITGERAIGKTSIASYCRWIAEGKMTTFDDETLDLLVINSIVHSGQEFTDILSSIITEIQMKLDDGQGVEILKKIWDTLEEVHLGPAGIKKAIKNKLITLSSDEFCYFLEGVWKKIEKSRQGMLIIIDEFDRINDFKGVASFFKALIEKLESDGYPKITFILCGMPICKEKLFEDHPSVLRNFEPIELKLMPNNEAEEVVNKALAGTGIAIHADALSFIVSISGGYPHFLQEIGYSAFEVNKDLVIDPNDVRDGVIGTLLYSGSIKRLGEKYFDRMYDSEIQSDAYREILNIIAKHNNQFVSRQEILIEFSKGKTSLDSYLQNLVKRGILIKDKTKLGFYAIPNEMFRIYIRMRASAFLIKAQS